MEDIELIEMARQALMLVIQLGTPPMVVGLVVGVTIALFQALTQIQEITLVFVPKIIAVFFTIFIFFPSMAEIMTAFFDTIADRMMALD